MPATPEQWAQARKKYETSHVTGAALAKELGVSGAAVSKRMSKEGWVKAGVKQEQVNQSVVKLNSRGKPLKRTGDTVRALVKEAAKQSREWNAKHSPEKWKAWCDLPDAMEEFCTYVTENGVEGSLAGFCREKDFGISTLHRWIASDPSRVESYTRAKEGRADVLFDTLLGISTKEPERDERGRIDPGWVQWQRLIVDTAKWGATKLNQGLYGDKTSINVSGTVHQTSDRAEMMAELAKLTAQGMKLPMLQDVTDVEPKG